MVQNQPIPVLIIDDSRDDFSIISECLRDVPGICFKSTWCDNYADGLAAVLSGDYQVATVDYRMGPDNSIDLILEAVKEGVNTPLILLTGSDSQELDNRAMEAGAADFLDKASISPDLLGRTIRHALQRQVLEDDRNRYADTLQAIMDHSPFGVWVSDLNGRFRFANKTVACQVGELNEPMAGRKVGALFGAQAQEAFSNHGGRRSREDGLNDILYASLSVPDMGVRDFKITRVAIRDRHHGVAGFLGISEDVTEASRLQAEVTYQATHDPLTGLFNRAVFEQKAKQVCETIGPDDAPYSLLFMDLDRFKVVNDTWGHEAGDQLLRKLASVYIEQLRKTDRFVTLEGEHMEPPMARLGGDEFGVLLSNCREADASLVARRLIDATNRCSIDYEGNRLGVGCSIGLVEVNANNLGWEKTIKQADHACYVAKDKGKGRVHVYGGEDVGVGCRQQAMIWSQKVQQGLEEDRLELFFQPIAPMHGDEVGDRFEILLRYRDNGQLVDAKYFLPAMERFSMMPAVDRWVISRAFADLEKVYGQGAPYGMGRTLKSAAINLSGQSLGEKWLTAHIERELDRSSLSPCQICFEITETAAIHNLEEAKRLIHTLRRRGVSFSLDDFGSGLSLFAYLRELNLDYVKVDGAFVRDVVTDPVAREMVSAVHRVGRIMGLKVVAEGVEDPEAMALLKSLDIDYVQGYLVGRPAPLVPPVAV